jgi:hypothetical protein
MARMFIACVTRPLLIAALLLGLPFLGTTLASVAAEPATYEFTALAFLGGAAPGGGTFVTDFEAGRISNRGQITFVADVSPPGSGEGAFIARKGQISQIARVGDRLPGGKTVGPFSLLTPVALNDRGDAAITADLSQGGQPLGIDFGIYRRAHTTGTLSPVMLPGVTPAPGGGTFLGARLHTEINNRGDLVFAGIFPTHLGIQPNRARGVGVFLAEENHRISSVVSPGDPAPGGGRFDFAQNPSINDRGDIAFGAHVAGEECITLGDVDSLFCAESVYLKVARRGEIRSIAHQGQPAPGGGRYRLAFGPELNKRGDLVFAGDLTPPPDAGNSLGVFLHSRGTTTPVARPGDAMPGGGTLATTSFTITNYNINDVGQVVFNGALTNGDHGLWVRSPNGTLQLVAKTGTTIPGVGTIDKLTFFGERAPNGGAVINNDGELLFGATLAGGGGVLLAALPKE